ncbi:MAG TPA: LysM domain-containing protein [Candidatus Caenarcaniphilales bacterium]|nr:LysM domain-containing protein [Candidatus Caenarcaniphilales bacterium]
MTAPYPGSDPTGTRVSAVAAFLLGMALLATLVAIVVAMGLLRLPDRAPVAAASPSGTAFAAASPSAAPSAPSPSDSPTASVAAETASPLASGGFEPTPGGIHIVESGESLEGIGELYGIPWQLIAEANEIEDPDRIFVGQELVIPVAANATTGADVHYVQPGESISSIALQYDVTPTELADANGIEDWNLIYVGQALIIPGAEPAESPTPES